MGGIYKDATVWLDGARPPSKVLVNSFKLKWDLLIASIKIVHVCTSEFVEFST
jgi:hypothetical protein